MGRCGCCWQAFLWEPPRSGALRQGRKWGGIWHAARAKPLASCCPATTPKKKIASATPVKAPPFRAPVTAPGGPAQGASARLLCASQCVRVRSGDLSHKIKKIRQNLGAIGFHCQSGLREVAHGNSSHQGSS
jgi:hypothetical protein